MNTDHYRAGTAYFPEPDVASADAGRTPAPAPRPGSPLRGLPRRRRPAMLALCVTMAAAGVVVSAGAYQHADHQVQVVTVVRPVPAGAVITAADLSTTSVDAGSGVAVVPAAGLTRVTGKVAAVPLRPATLLAPSDLATSRPPGPAEDLVPVAVRPDGLPASGLAPGDHVLVAATPGDQGQAGTGDTAPPLLSPAGATVLAVDDVPDAAGFDVVDLLVSKAAAVAVAGQVSTGEFTLIVTRRAA